MVELLVVVAIIGLLAGIIIVGVGGSLARGRDARRIAELNTVRNALELYRAKNVKYPEKADFATMKAEVDGAGIGVRALPDGKGLSPQKLYKYGHTGGTSYTLGVDLEDSGNTNLGGDIDGASDGIDCGTAVGDTVYCISL